MNTQKFIELLIANGWTVNELASGKTRAINNIGGSYLLSPLEAVKFGTWLNESTKYVEALPVLSCPT